MLRFIFLLILKNVTTKHPYVYISKHFPNFIVTKFECEHKPKDLVGKYMLKETLHYELPYQKRLQLK